MKVIKTNAMRILDKNKIDYEEFHLDIKEAYDGVTCANMLGVDPSITYKTLVTISKSKNYYVMVVPVAKKLDLKKGAKAVGEKDLEMLPLKELLGVTGYVHGGCSPVGMKKVFKTVIDSSALNYDKIIFSGGKIGYFVKVNPQDIKEIIPLSFEDIVGE